MLGENTYFKIKLINVLLIAAVIYGYNRNVSLWETRESLKVQEARADMAEQKLADLEASLDALIKEYGNNLQEVTKSVPNSKFKDGVYEGTGSGFAGNITVEVTIANGVIESIEIIDSGKDDSAYVDMASGVIDDMLEIQSFDVDTVSGATFSSNGIKNAVAAALQEAERQ